MKLAIITGSRADWSGLEVVGHELKRLGHDVECLSLWPNYSIAFPNTVLPSLYDRHLSSSPEMRAMQGCEFSSTLAGKPDCAILCGDRSEVLAAAFACYMKRIPIAHIAGGDITLGSADDAMRNAITALASLHFPTHVDAMIRLIRQCGVHHSRVFECGSPALDRVLSVRPVPVKSFPMVAANCVNVIVSIHPTTMESSPDITDSVLAGIGAFEAVPLADDLRHFFITATNRDSGWQKVASKLVEFTTHRKNCTLLPEDFPPDDFVRLMHLSHCIVGNSSAGVYEAPAIGLPSIIVGDRQDGRPRTAWRYVHADAQQISQALLDVCCRGPGSRLTLKHSIVFGDGHAGLKIAETLNTFTDFKRLLKRGPI